MRRRGELVELSFAHVLDRGGMRRAWLRGRENVHKRYLIHVAGFNLGILMRALFGKGTPREAASVKNAFLFFIQSDFGLAIAIVAEVQGETAVLVMTVATETNYFKSDCVIGLLSLPKIGAVMEGYGRTATITTRLHSAAIPRFRKSSCPLSIWCFRT
jgi:hypothetical protein